MFWFYFGVFYFSYKYLMLCCSFPKLDVSKSCSCSLLIPPISNPLIFMKELGLTISSLFVHALFFFIFSYVFSIFGVLVIMFGLAILVRVFLEYWVSCLGWPSWLGCFWESSSQSSRFNCGRSQRLELY